MTLDDLFTRTTQRGSCRLWTRSCAGPRRDYGQIVVGGKRWRAHRLAWTLANGDAPKGASVLHRCDNPKCVNPEHLFLGTQADNMRDMRDKRRARAPAGEAHRDAKLSLDDVRRIKFGGEPLTNLAVELGITYTSAHAARTGITWKHVTEQAA